MLYSNIMQDHRPPDTKTGTSSLCTPSAPEVFELQARIWAEVNRCYRMRERTEGLTQAALARRLDLPRSQVCAWLRHPEKMTIKAAARLLEAMDARIECHLSISISSQDGKLQ